MKQHPIRMMCKMLDVHPSGFYAWRDQPFSMRAKEIQAIVGNIKLSWLESRAVCGYRKLHDDLCAQGIRCGQQRVRRLMKVEGLRSQTGYWRRRPKSQAGQAHLAVLNVLERQFEVDPQQALGDGRHLHQNP